MSKLPRITGKKLIKVLSNFGFQVLRSQGSHHFLQHQDGRCTVIPVHGSEIIGIGLLSKILKDCDVAKEEIAQFI